MNNPVSIILVNYNNWSDTVECLESIISNDYKNFTIIVVDNNSSDHSVEKIAAWADDSNVKYLLTEDSESKIDLGHFNEDRIQLIIFRSSKNGGFASGNNIGIGFGYRNFNSEFYWLLNNDTVIDKDSLNLLVKKATENIINNRKVGILGSVLLYYQNPERIQSIGGRYNKYLAKCTQVHNNEIYGGVINPVDFDYVIGASMFVRKDFLDDVGLMNEEYFLYFEELDWTIRAKQKGWFSEHVLESKIYHKEGGSTQKKDVSYFTDLIQIRSRILFTKNFFSEALIIVYLMIIISILRRIMRKQFNRIIPIVKIMVNPGRTL